MAQANAVTIEMAGKHDDDILALMNPGEPCTPNDIAIKLKVHQKTAQSAMMELALDGKLKHRKIGRYHMFWRTCP